MFIILLGLTACSNDNQQGPPPAKPFREQVVDDVFEAAQSPLVDIGMKRETIPPKLLEVAAKPYALSTPIRCSELTKEIAELDTLLETDIDITAVPEPSGREKYVSEGSDMALGAARGFTMSKVGIIPFTGIVRRVSGAEKHAKAVAKAYQAGRLRRAYLKGVAKASNCSPPDKSSGAQSPSEMH